MATAPKRTLKLDRIEREALDYGLTVERYTVGGTVSLEITNPHQPDTSELVVSSWTGPGGRGVLTRATHGGRVVDIKRIRDVLQDMLWGRK